MLSKHLDKNNLHHAYLIEGVREEILPELLKFIGSLKIKTLGNPDFTQIHIDSFKVDDARNLKSYAANKGFSVGKKIFLVSVNSFLLEAQNTLLKLFEEPIENTHFFLIVPDTNSLLKTFVSRFYLIKKEDNENLDSQEAEKFITMPLQKRIDFIKELLVEPEEEDEILVSDSTRSKALKFLNALESTLHEKFLKNSSEFTFFEHIFKVREFLRMPGSSTKSLMESVALIIPVLQ